jgi:hypothetical protein
MVDSISAFLFQESSNRNQPKVAGSAPGASLTLVFIEFAFLAKTKYQERPGLRFPWS